MPPRDPNMPEGTDSIIDGGSDLGGSDYGQASAFDTSPTGGDAGSFGTPAGGGSDFGMSDPLGGGTGNSSFSGGTTSAPAEKMDVQSLKTQATDKVRDAASQGKDKATEALDSVSRMVSETADTVDDRLGPQYGNYVRKAADALDGLNDSLRNKQVDELFDDARNLVRKSPAIAIGAAAAIGFLLIRLVKSGMPQDGGQSGDYYSNDRLAGSDRMIGSAPRVDNSYDPVA